MTGGQIAALVVALILLLPGGCFLLLGIGFATDSGSTDDLVGGAMIIGVAAIILVPAGFLFWIAFRRPRHPPSAGL